MGMKNVILTAILVLFITANVSHAELLGKSRKLDAASPPIQDPNPTDIPSPSPVVSDETEEISEPGSPPEIPEKKNLKDEQTTHVTTPAPALPPSVAKEHSESPKEGVKGGTNDAPKKKGKSKDKKSKDDGKGKEKVVDKKPKDDGKGEEKVEDTPLESCDGIKRRCKDDKSLVACVKSFDDASKALALLIQNKGDSSLKVVFTFSSPGNKQDLIGIPQLQTKQVNISNVGGDELKLNAGNGYCVLPLNPAVPVIEENYFQWHQSYSKFMTPIYGAYLVLATSVVAAGVCACCWLSRRRRQSDVPYQELEMSMPESAAAAPAETAEGWDEVWDDDWEDEEKAVKSPGHAISGNGLTSRAPIKEDWEDWDE